MTVFATTLQAFFTDRLVRQRHASPHTVAAYRDAIKLLLAFAQQRTASSHPTSISPTSMSSSSARFLTISSTSAGTLPGRETPGSRRSALCSDSPRFAIPSMLRASPACWRSRPNASSVA
jgi:hypothetical protein